MDAKLLTENGWKTVAQKAKIKDCGLQRALSAYETLDDDEPAGKTQGGRGGHSGCHDAKESEGRRYRTGTQSSISRASWSPRRRSSVSWLRPKPPPKRLKPPQRKQTRRTRRKPRLKAKLREQEKQRAAAESEDDEEEEDEVWPRWRRLNARSSRSKRRKASVLFHRLRCEALRIDCFQKRHPQERPDEKGIGETYRRQHPPAKVGTGRRESSKLIFEMEKPVPGLARILQKWIKNSTGLGFKVMVGTESAEDEEQPSVAEGKEAGPAKMAGRDAGVSRGRISCCPRSH